MCGLHDKPEPRRHQTEIPLYLRTARGDLFSLFFPPSPNARTRARTNTKRRTHVGRTHIRPLISLVRWRSAALACVVHGHWTHITHSYEHFERVSSHQRHTQLDREPCVYFVLIVLGAQRSLCVSLFRFTHNSSV